MITTLRLGSILSIGLNKPSKLNCVCPKMADELSTVIDNFEKDPEVKAGVLYGEGGTFCSGFDLSILANGMQDLMKKLKEGDGYMGPTRREFIKKPIVGAIQGYAYGGGLELALMCDLLVMEENAFIGCLNRSHGVPLIDGGTVRLPQKVGLSRALDWVLSGRKISAKEAHEAGLISAVCKPGTAVGQAFRFAKSISMKPNLCMLVDRKSLYKNIGADFETAIQQEFVNGMKVIESESIPGAREFVNRKKDD